MLLENIPLGKTLEIYVEREDFRYRLVSKVEDVNEHRVCVTAIASNGHFFNFRPEDSIKLVYRDQDVMWEWPKVKAGLAKLEGEPVHYFLILDKGRTFNRRNAYRVSILEDITITYYRIPGRSVKYADVPPIPTDMDIPDDNAEKLMAEISRPITTEGMVKDVSENGVGIFCNTPLDIDDSILFNIPSTFGPLPVKALVVRKVQMNSVKAKYDNYYGCVLLQSDKRLLKFIFDLQREMIKKKKGLQ